MPLPITLPGRKVPTAAENVRAQLMDWLIQVPPLWRSDVCHYCEGQEPSEHLVRFLARHAKLREVALRYRALLSRAARIP